MSNICACFIFFHIVRSAVQLSPKSEGIFHKINDQSLAVLDGLLLSLKLEKNFTKWENMTDYISMHNIVQDAIVINDHEYEKIFKMGKTEICNKTAYFVSNINKIIEEMIIEKNTRHMIDDFMKDNNILHDDNSVDFVNLSRALDIKIHNSSDLKLLDPQILRVSSNSRRLYDGYRTRITQYPFMASIHVNHRFTCAGCIIREDLVLTAASCLLQFISRKFDVAAISVRVGSEFTTKSGKMVSVVNMRFHPLFNTTTLHHNLVILKLRKPLKFKRGRLTGIQLDKKAEIMSENVDGVTILGWGDETTKRYESEGDRQLSEAFVPLYSLEACMKIYSRSYVTTENFCVGYSDKPSGACQNDIGGPAIAGSVLMGVISFGPPRCGRSHTPTVFTKVGYYADWITNAFVKIPDFDKFSSYKLTNEDKKTEQSEEIYDYSEQVDTNDYNAVNEIISDLKKIGRQNSILLDLYDSLDKIDTFETTIPQPIEQHPLIDKGIFLDPNLVQIPDFSESGETSLLPPLTESTPGIFIPENKEEEANPAWDSYKQFVLQLFHPTTKTTTSTSTTPPPTIKRLTWPPHFYNLNASENAYDEFTLKSTLFSETANTITETDSTKAVARIRQSASSDESESDISESDSNNDYAHVKLENVNSANRDRLNHMVTAKDKINNVPEIIFLDTGFTERYALNNKDVVMKTELTRLKNKLLGKRERQR